MNVCFARYLSPTLCSHKVAQLLRSGFGSDISEDEEMVLLTVLKRSQNFPDLICIRILFTILLSEH